MEVVVGTYEELLLSYRLTKSDKEDGYKLEPAFTDHSHTGSVRSVAINEGGILASGGTDEIIRLFNLKRRLEHGLLMHHTGTVTSLSFHGRKHMFSGSEDGTVGVWKIGKWECLRTFRGHKGAVYSVAVHPSGKLALSVGKDKTLRTWNLVKGRSAYITNIKEVADFVRWTPLGDRYVVVINNRLDVYNVETAEVEHTIDYTTRISAVTFLQDNIMAIGGDGGTIQIHDLSKNSKVYEFSTDTNRVKGMQCCKCPAGGSSVWLVSGSSDGFIKIWKVDCPSDQSEQWSSALEAELDTKFRITCLDITVEKQPKQPEDKDESKDEEGDDATEEVEDAGESSEELEEEVEEEEAKKSSLKDVPSRKQAKSKGTKTLTKVLKKKVSQEELKSQKRKKLVSQKKKAALTKKKRL